VLIQQDARLWIVIAKAIRNTLAIELVPLPEGVASVVGCHPVRDRIEFRMNLWPGRRRDRSDLARWAGGDHDPAIFRSAILPLLFLSRIDESCPA
jgi:hypothetical protein